MLGRLSLVGLIATVASVWLGAMLGTTGTTLGSFTAATVNSTSLLSDAPLPSPLVSAITPADTATNVPKGIAIVVVFSESMDQGLTGQAFQLLQVSGGACTPAAPCAVAGTISWPKPYMLRFAPASPLAAPSVSYQVNITGRAAATQTNGFLTL